MRLTELENNKRAVISKINSDTRQKLRLYELGLCIGEEITPQFDSMMGGIRAYRVMGCIIALRDSDAFKIEVERVSD